MAYSDAEKKVLAICSPPVSSPQKLDKLTALLAQLKSRLDAIRARVTRDECADAAPCANGATCIPTLAGHKCICESGWTVR